MKAVSRLARLVVLALAVPAAVLAVARGSGLSTVASACTGVPHVTPMIPPAGATAVPRNARVVFLSRTHSLDAIPVEARLVGAGATLDGRTSTAPHETLELAPPLLAANTTYTVEGRLVAIEGQPLDKLAELRTGSHEDHEAPKLAVLSGPTYPAATPELPCTTAPDVVFRVRVEDASPSFVVAFAWTGTMPANPEVVDARLPEPDGRLDLRIRPSADVRAKTLALMAVDAAGNRGEVVVFPGNKRLPAFTHAIFGGAPAAALSSPPPSAASAGVSPSAPPPAPLSGSPPPVPPSSGCGCDAAGAARTPTTALALALAASLLVRRRLQRRIRKSFGLVGQVRTLGESGGAPSCGRSACRCRGCSRDR